MFFFVLLGQPLFVKSLLSPMQLYRLMDDIESLVSALIGMVISAFIAVTIFIFSLYKTEKRIINNKYYWWWVVYFNIVLTILVYISIAALVFLIGGLSGVEGEEGLGFVYILVYGMFIIPLVVILFSIIPSIFFYKFYSNQKIFRVISRILWILLIIFAAYVLFGIIYELNS